MDRPVFILGGSQTDFRRNWSKEGKTFVAILQEVVEDCFQSVRLDHDELRALIAANRMEAFVGNFAAELYARQGHLGAFLTEIDPVFNGMPSARYEAACASGSVAVDAAQAKLRAGCCELALVVGIEVMKTVPSAEGGDFLGTAAYYARESRGKPYPFPNLFGRLADVLLERYALEENRFMRALAAIAAINYSNAKHNPLAQTRTWFMNRENAERRGTRFNASVGGRLCVSDCSQITDGAVALVLSTAEYAQAYARKRGIPLDRLPRIKGWGARVAPMTMEAKMRESLATPHVLPWTCRAVNDAYRRAGLTVADIGVFEAHDCFTSSEFAQISAFGLTPPGRECEAVESGNIAFGGHTPVNPGGGLIGIGHPVGASGVRMLLDLYRQMSRTAGECQVPNVRNGVMLNIGGSATTNMVFVVGVDA